MGKINKRELNRLLKRRNKLIDSPNWEEHIEELKTIDVILDEDEENSQREPMFKFTLTKEQLKKLHKWKGSLTQADNYAGAIGGTFSYIFTPTSIGTVCKVICNLTEEEIDISDYETW